MLVSELGGKNESSLDKCWFLGIAGSIFASPPSSDIFRLIVEMKRRGAKQILVIILNYTGDRLNFGLAMERARELSIDVDMLVVADDAAVDSSIG